jgi:DNA repair protein RecO (recombination protein O)
MLGFCLHTVAWSETSVVAELFTRELGRVGVLAKGAKRKGSALRGVLMQFQPLEVALSGKGELRTLIRADWVGGMLPPSGEGLLLGFYLNELLVRLLPKEAPEPEIFDAYRQTLQLLAQAPEDALRTEEALRRFEWTLLRHAGYAPDLRRDARGQAIEAHRWYDWGPEQGFVERPGTRNGAQGGCFSGQVLLALEQPDAPLTVEQPTHPALAQAQPSVSLRQQARNLSRAILAHCLDGKPLKTRQLLIDLHRL